MNRMIILLLAFSIADTSPCWGWQNNTTEDVAIKGAQSDPFRVRSTAQPDDQIGPNDSVSVVALESEEVSKTWRVTSEGDIDLPMVGKIHAAGLTSEQLQGKLTEGLRRYIREPHVTVYLVEVRSQPVTVSGAVHRPGTFQTEGPKTLLSVLSMAGGLEKTPGTTVTITRHIRYGAVPLPGAFNSEDGQYSTAVVPVKEILDPSSAASNLLIRPNDAISVSTSDTKIYLIGEVLKPGAIELVTTDSVSVLQALAAAGGLSKLANPRHTEIMRKNEQGLYSKVAEIDLKKLVNGRVEDRLLTPGDVLVVPSSNLKLYSGMAAVSAIATATYTLARF